MQPVVSDIGTDMLVVDRATAAVSDVAAAAEHAAEALQAENATTAVNDLAATDTHTAANATAALCARQNEDARGTHPLSRPQAAMPAMAISAPPAPITTNPSRRRAAAQAAAQPAARPAAQPAAQPAAPAAHADDANAVEVFSVSRERAEAVHASFLDQQAAAAVDGGSPGATLAAAPLTKGVNRQVAMWMLVAHVALSHDCDVGLSVHSLTEFLKTIGIRSSIIKAVLAITSNASVCICPYVTAHTDTVLCSAALCTAEMPCLVVGRDTAADIVLLLASLSPPTGTMPPQRAWPLFVCNSVCAHCTVP